MGINTGTVLSQNPAIKNKVTCTGFGWEICMIKEFTSMLLDTWKTRCGCLHGTTKAEKKLKRRKKIQKSVRRCYGWQGEVILEHQDFFSQPVEDMVRKRNPQYLLAWVNMFYALVLLSGRKKGGTSKWVEDGEESVATFDTWFDDMDMEEYLVDAIDGIEREWDITDEIEVQSN